MIDYELIRDRRSLRAEVTRRDYSRGYPVVIVIATFDSYDCRDPEQEAIDYIATMDDSED